MLSFQNLLVAPLVEIMMPRDTDTRIFLREKLAVDEWLKSGKLIHIMRDHILEVYSESQIPSTRKLNLAHFDSLWSFHVGESFGWQNLVASIEKARNSESRSFSSKGSHMFARSM